MQPQPESPAPSILAASSCRAAAASTAERRDAPKAPPSSVPPTLPQSSFPSTQKRRALNPGLRQRHDVWTSAPSRNLHAAKLDELLPPPKLLRKGQAVLGVPSFARASPNAVIPARCQQVVIQRVPSAFLRGAPSADGDPRLVKENDPPEKEAIGETGVKRGVANIWAGERDELALACVHSSQGAHLNYVDHLPPAKTNDSGKVWCGLRQRATWSEPRVGWGDLPLCFLPQLRVFPTSALWLAFRLAIPSL